MCLHVRAVRMSPWNSSWFARAKGALHHRNFHSKAEKVAAVPRKVAEKVALKMMAALSI